MDYEPLRSAGLISTQFGLNGRQSPGARSGKAFLPISIFCITAPNELPAPTESVVRNGALTKTCFCAGTLPSRIETASLSASADRYGGFAARRHEAPGVRAQVRLERLKALPVTGTILRP